MTTSKKAKLNKSDRTTNIYKQRVTALLIPKKQINYSTSQIEIT